MSDDIERLREQMSTLQQENEYLRAQLARQHTGAARQLDYEAVYYQFPLSVIIYQLDGTLLDGNAMTEQIFNTPRDAVIGTYNLLKNPENIKLGVSDYFTRAVRGEIAKLPPVFFSTRSVEGRYEDKSIWVQTTFVPIRDASGMVIHIAAIEMDVTERIVAEQARDELQNQLLRSQEETIRELSTPLIPISDTTVVMPLIGTIDSQRATLVLETLLEGVARYQAELAILDITGVQMVDTQVAQALIQAAQAVKLLGAQVMLTGIQPQIAQTLVHLGVDLGGIITRGSLQAGIADAFLHQQNGEHR